MELAHGKRVNFMVSFVATPNWGEEFARGFVKDMSDRTLKTLVAQIHTSVGQMIEVRPESNLIERLKNTAEPT